MQNLNQMWTSVIHLIQSLRPKNHRLWYECNRLNCRMHSTASILLVLMVYVECVCIHTIYWMATGFWFCFLSTVRIDFVLRRTCESVMNIFSVFTCCVRFIFKKKVFFFPLESLFLCVCVFDHGVRIDFIYERHQKIEERYFIVMRLNRRPSFISLSIGYFLPSET